MLKNFKTYQLAVVLFQECEQIKCPAHIKDQLQRASAAIVLNLAEGYGRQSPKDRKKFYVIALGGLREVQAILELTPSNKSLPLADQVGGCLWKLIKCF